MVQPGNSFDPKTAAQQAIDYSLSQNVLPAVPEQRSPSNVRYDFAGLNPNSVNPVDAKGMVIPSVYESNFGRSTDIYSRLLEDRIIMLTTQINDEVASNVVAQLLWLQKENSVDPIKIYLMSPGGSITAGCAIYDTMQMVTPPVQVWIMGQAASMGTILTCGAEKGHRYALPNTRFMIHQARVQQGPGGTASDLQVFTDELVRVNDKMIDILAEKTGQPRDKVKADCERDYYMSAQEALKYGLIDEIVGAPGETTPVQNKG